MLPMKRVVVAAAVAVLTLAAPTASADDATNACLSASEDAQSLRDEGKLLDARAKSAYRRRLAEIEDELAQARALGDAERESQADAERDFLVRELKHAVGLGGRDRRAASASERARVGVTRAIRYAIARIGEHHPLLGEHLSLAIRTGTYCGYLPDPRSVAARKG